MAKTITVDIVGDASSLSRAFGSASRSADSFGSSLGGKLASGLRTVAIAAGAAAVALGVAFAKVVQIGVKSLIEHEKASAQTAAALKSMGTAAGVTVKDVEALADSIEKMSGVDDVAVQSAENLLLTFENVHNEVGKGNDIFNRATMAVTDMSVAMGTDMSAAAVQVGKALNDPIAGLTALTRVGVQFTDAQKEQIKAMVEAGDVMGAQKIILGELEKQFGGSAAALGDTFAGKVNILRERFEEMAEAVASRVMPHLEAFVGFLGRLGEAESFGEALRIIGEGIKELGTSLFNAVKDAVTGIDWAGVAKTAWDGLSTAFTAAWGSMKQIDFSGLSQNITEGLGSALGKIDWGAVVSSAVKIEVEWVKFFATLGPRIIIGIVQALVGADWGAIGTAIIDGIKGAVSGLGSKLDGIWEPIKSSAATAASFIADPFVEAFETVQSAIGEAAGFVIDRFADIVETAGDFAGLFDWIPGVGDDLGGLADRANDAAEDMRGFADSLRDGQSDATSFAGSLTQFVDPAFQSAIGLAGTASGSLSAFGASATGQVGPLNSMTGGVMDLTGALGNIPDNRATHITTPGSEESTTQADNVNSAVRRIPDKSRTNISESGGSHVQQQAEGISSAIRSIPQSWHTTYTFSGQPPADWAHFASGGKVSRATMAVVGEEGPELVVLPGGSEVLSSSESERIANNAIGAGRGVTGSDWITQFFQQSMDTWGSSSAAPGKGDFPGKGSFSFPLPGATHQAPVATTGVTSPVIIHVHVAGSVTAEGDLVRAIRAGLANESMYTPSLWAGRA